MKVKKIEILRAKFAHSETAFANEFAESMKKQGYKLIGFSEPETKEGLVIMEKAFTVNWKKEKP
jgi:hypothetical protein